MKFKIGDRVKVVSLHDGSSGARKKLVGKIFTIREINPNGSNQEKHYGVVEDCPYIFFEDELKLLKKEFTKSDLKNGMIVELRNGFRGIVINDNLILGNKLYSELLNYNDDLSIKYNLNGNDLDIIKVYTAWSYMGFEDYLKDDNLDIIWERQESKKMTLKQVEEALGYKIEIISN